MSAAVSFLSQPGCHLCSDTLPSVRRLCRTLGIELVEVDINSSAELVQEFALRIPVVTDPEGFVLAEGIIQKRTLRKALKRFQRRVK